MIRLQIRTILTLVLLLAAFLAGIFLTTRVLRPLVTETRSVDRLAVIRSVRSILKLATVEMHLAEIVTYRDEKRILSLFPSEKNAIYRVQGRVLAGFDLTQDRLDIQLEPERQLVRIRLPRAQVLAIDPNIEILDENSGWMNPVTSGDRNIWYRWARADLRRSALDAGITQRAETETRSLIESLVGGYGLHVEVSFAGEIRNEDAPLAGPIAPEGGEFQVPQSIPE